LRKNVEFNWDEKCQKTFDILKEYLASPPVLVPPVQGKPLLLYISTTSTTLGDLLA